MGLTLDEEHGGLQLPHVVASACMAWFTAANIGTAAYSFLTVANAGLLLAHGTPEQVERYVQPMLEGRFFGTMTLSEPHAGSSLGDVTTRAVPADDGTHRIFGSKMWISGGDHEMGDNIVHLVLAKLPDAPAGSRGISLFIVPKHLVADDGSIGERNDVVLAGHQPQAGQPRHGQHGAGLRRAAPSRRAVPPGAVGYLVGEPHKGLSYMFHMMNAARLGVGMSATHHGLHGLPQVARLRPRPPAGPLADRRRPDRRRRCRSSSTPTCAGCCWRRSPTSRARWRSNLYCARLLDEQADRRGRRRAARDGPAARRADADRQVVAVAVGPGEPTAWRSRCSAARATPATTTSRRTGATTGSTRSTRAPTASRRLDLLGRKVLGGGGAALLALAGRIEQTVARATRARRRAGGVRRRAEGRGRPARRGHWRLAGLGDPDRTLANATVYLEAAGHVVVAWMWLEQLVAVRGADRRLLRRQAGRPRATSSAGSCRRWRRSSTCSPRATPRRWRCARTGSRQARRSPSAARASPGRPARRPRRGVRRARAPAPRRPRWWRSGRRGRSGAATTTGRPPSR